MIRRIKRYIYAFFTALKLTLRGEAIQPAEQRYPQLTRWVQEGEARAKAALSAADAAGLSKEQRQTITLHLDMRDISMDVILESVRHNMTMEYPLLLDTHYDHTITTLYALNMNDQYRVGQLMQADAIAEYDSVQRAVGWLHEHLLAIPSSTAQ